MNPRAGKRVLAQRSISSGVALGTLGMVGKFPEKRGEEKVTLIKEERSKNHKGVSPTNLNRAEAMAQWRALPGGRLMHKKGSPKGNNLPFKPEEGQFFQRKKRKSHYS